MNTIILATDFSAAASNAANYAADMAVAINADILLLNIAPLPVMYSDVPPITAPQQMEESAEDALSAIKKQIVRKYGNRLHVGTRVEMGLFATTLESVCNEVGPFLVVMGTQGTSDSERIVFGSHTMFALKHLMWPILAIPKTAVFSEIKKIAFACDFDKLVDKKAIDDIAQLVKVFNARLHVINTGPASVHNADTVFQAGALQIRLQSLRPEYHFIDNRDIDEGIMEFCEKNDIDLLTVLHKRHGLIHQLVKRSHTKNLILHSHVPVMAFSD